MNNLVLPGGERRGDLWQTQLVSSEEWNKKAVPAQGTVTGCAWRKVCSRLPAEFLSFINTGNSVKFTCCSDTEIPLKDSAPPGHLLWDLIAVWERRKTQRTWNFASPAGYAILSSQLSWKSSSKSSKARLHGHTMQLFWFLIQMHTLKQHSSIVLPGLWHRMTVAYLQSVTASQVWVLPSEQLYWD